MRTFSRGPRTIAGVGDARRSGEPARSLSTAAPTVALRLFPSSRCSTGYWLTSNNMRLINKLLVVVAVATLATQPIVVWAKPCACRTPAAPVEVRADAHPCCAQRAENVATAAKRVDRGGANSPASCTLKNSSHAVGDCCCVTKAPESATLPSVAAPVEPSTAHWVAYLSTAAESFSETPRLSALRFGSPAELAYSSHPTLSILYCVWRN